MTTVVVAGALASKTGLGGEAWVRLSYLLGLRDLGCEVAFVEQVGSAGCSDEALRTFDHVLAAFGAEPAWLVRGDGVALRGSEAALETRAAEADLLLNVSGNLSCDPFFTAFRRRAYVDLDPGYTQFWLAEGHDVGRVQDHEVHFTVGLGVAAGTADLPDSGVTWLPTLPPVPLGEWPVARAVGPERLTTVASWRGGYGRLEHNGRLFGQKAHEFRRLAALPRTTHVTLEVALSIDAADEPDRAALADGGWRIADPSIVAGDPWSFRQYVQESAGELSPAQGIYVETRSGWFSDRTARYLASGKPAIVQDTAAGDHLPVGEGLLEFRTPAEATAAIEKVVGDYETHCRSARRIAEQHLGSRAVLTRLLAEALP